MKKICFVCHGNICRSTMAEFVMKKLVADAGLSGEFLIESKACHSDELGNDTYPGTKEVLRKHKIPFTKRAAVKITKEDYAKFDFIIGMDKENLADLLALTDNDPDKKISLLMEWAGRDDEVADPWYTHNFDITYEDVFEGCSCILAKLK